MVKTIFYEKDRKLCIVSKQDKKEPDTYLSVRNCTKSKKSERDKKSNANREKSKIKLLCELDKINVIKQFDGTLVNKWYDKKFIKKNLSLIAEPVKYETSKNSLAIWIDESGMLLDYHDDNTFPNMADALGLFNFGFDLYKKGEWNKAMQKFREVIKANPTDKCSTERPRSH